MFNSEIIRNQIFTKPKIILHCVKYHLCFNILQKFLHLVYVKTIKFLIDTFSSFLNSM